MERRQVIAGLGTLALPGCATVGHRPRATCLPKVDVSSERVIRTVAGLRPYRASGFVVRAESLNGKTIVHNYGHGGGGISLSWGSSRLAADLGLPGHRGPVAVIGAGVMGLTTARLVQEAGFPVTIHTAALPPDTTSNIAGGQWAPVSLYRPDAVTPEWRAQFAAAARYSWRRFQIMVGDEYGIRWLPTYAQSDGGPPDPIFAGFPPASHDLVAAGMPFPAEHMLRFDTMYVETGHFLRQLTRDMLIAGGRIEVRRFATRADVAALPETLVFNCTGLGARDLFGDTELEPVRGQLAILLPQPEVNYAYTLRAGYMFPRPDGIVLGGTFEHGVWSTEPDPAAIARMLENHRTLMAGMRC